MLNSLQTPGIRALYLSVAILCSNSSAVASLSKKQALEFMKTNGYKWQLTQTLEKDSENKLLEAESEFRPRVGLGFRQYAARINPIQFGGSEPQTYDTVGFGTTALEANWTLMDPIGKAKLLSATANQEMSHSQVQHYQSELTALLISNYLSVQRLQSQLKSMDANLAKSEVILKLLEMKQSVGAGLPVEILKAKNLVQLDRLKRKGVQIKLMKAQHELALLIGKDNLDETLPELHYTQLNQSIEKSKAVQIALESRSDLKTAKVGLDAATMAKKETEGWLFPKFSVLAEVGSTQANLLGIPVKTLNGFIGMSLSIPIDSGGLIESKRKDALLLTQKAEIQVHQVQNEIQTQIQESIDQLAAAEEAVRAAQEFVKTSEEEEQMAQKKYKNGASGILDLASAHNNLATAKDTLIENVYNFEMAKLGYYRSLGSIEEYIQKSVD